MRLLRLPLRPTGPQRAAPGGEGGPEDRPHDFPKGDQHVKATNPRIVAICGSTRFMQQMADADRELTWLGRIVVKPGCDMKTPCPLWADADTAEAGKARLDDLHRAKIRLADEVLVVGDYVGQSTAAEIEYARSLGKPVRFTHPDVDPGEPAGSPASEGHDAAGNGIVARVGRGLSDLFFLVFLAQHTRRCPKGCGMFVRFRAVSEAEAQRWAAVVADHAGGHHYRPVGEAQ